MKKILAYAFLVCLVASCKKDKQEGTSLPSPADLLTRETWILTGHGFDDNNNHILDPGENVIQDCQKDNTYIFNSNGRGIYADNALVCGQNMNNDFSWELKNENKELEIDFEPLFVLRLNEEELVLNPVIPGLAVNYLLTYKH